MPDNIVRVLDGFVYRSGSAREKDMTPRPGRDVSRDLGEAGLSTWRNLEAAVKPNGKAQKIDLGKLDYLLLGCFEDGNGHVSIVPVDAAGNLDMMKLEEWAASLATGEAHPLSQMVIAAIVDTNIKRRK